MTASRLSWCADGGSTRHRLDQRDEINAALLVFVE